MAAVSRSTAWLSTSAETKDQIKKLERESLAVSFMDIFDTGVTTVHDLLAAMRRIDLTE